MALILISILIALGGALGYLVGIIAAKNVIEAALNKLHYSQEGELSAGMLNQDEQTMNTH